MVKKSVLFAGTLAVGVGEVDRSLGESLKVGRNHPGVVVERGNVVVEVVNADEQDIRLGREEGEGAQQENAGGDQE